MGLIFVVEDNENLREAVVSFLKLEEFEVEEFGKVQKVLSSIESQKPELIILDVMLPDGDGFKLAKDIRKISTVPIIFLTAKDSESSRITGFEVGCDDYVVKPFSPRELVLRVKALLKRSTSIKESTQSTTWLLDNDILVVDRGSHLLKLNNNEIKLTVSEWKIFEYLSDSSGIVVDRQRLLAACLDYNYEMSERTIITHIKNLRSKLGDSPWIETVRGFGYRFTGSDKE